MALTYTGTDGLFTHLGKLVKHYNLLKTDATNLSPDRDEILDAFQASDKDTSIDGLISVYERWKAEYAARRGELGAFALTRLQDKESVLDEIGAASTDQDEILRKLLEAMDTDSATVNESSVAIGSVTVDPDNAGGGKILTTDVLDGVTSPGSVNGVPFPSQVKYNGVTTELASSETFTFRVVADSFHDDVAEGSEEIVWEGKLPDEQHGVGEDGSGFISTIQPVHASTADHLTNADFETFTSDMPDDWDLVSGAAGTNVMAAGSTHADHGADALLFQGDATASSIEIKQDIASAEVVGRKRYCLAVKLKRDGATTGTLTVQFEGTGYTPGASEKISVAASSLSTSYQLHHFFITMPALIPSDFRLVIHWDGGTPGAAERVYVDDLALGPVYYGGGVGVVAVRDSNPFVREDRYEVTVTNTEGVFQAFFRRVFGVQLQSSSTPSIADSLAQ